MKKVVHTTMLALMVIVLGIGVIGCDDLFQDPDPVNNNDPTDAPEEERDDSVVVFRGDIGNTYDSRISGSSPIRATNLSNYYVGVVYEPHKSWFLEPDYEEFPISDDGSFEFSIERGTSFVACLVDKSRDWNKSIGVIGISTGDETHWEHIDTDQLGATVQLGTLFISSDDRRLLESENDIDNIGSTVEDRDFVNFSAAVDDSLRVVENFVNSDFEMRTWPNYQIRNTMRAGITEWNESYLRNYTYGGYQFYMNSRVNHGQSISLEVPYAVTFADGVTSFEATDSIGPDHIWSNTDFSEYPAGMDDISISYNIPEGGSSLLTSVPVDGTWILSDTDGAVVGKYNYSLAYPVEPDDTDTFTTMLPLLRVNIQDGTDDVIESVQLRWYRYDSDTDTFLRVPSEYLDKMIDFGGVGLTDFRDENARKDTYAIAETFGDDPIQIPGEWHLFDSETEANYATGIYVSIFNNGYSILFANRPENS